MESEGMGEPSNETYLELYSRYEHGSRRVRVYGEGAERRYEVEEDGGEPGHSLHRAQ